MKMFHSVPGVPCAKVERFAVPAGSPEREPAPRARYASGLVHIL